MKTLKQTIALLALLVAAFAASAQQIPGIDAPAEGVEFPPHLTGRGLKMNYGPFLAYSVLRMDGKKVDDFALAGITVRLGRNPVAALCFDAETMRVAAAWTGGYIDIGQTNLNGYKGGDLAHPLSPIVFATRSGPGWATTGDGGFQDPRPEFKKLGAVALGVDLPKHFGSLPEHIARYKGLYLHGEQVIFSYTVDKTAVLEAPGMSNEAGIVISRTLHIQAHDDAKTMLICETDRGAAIIQGQLALLEGGGTDSRTDCQSVLPETVVAVGVQAAPRGGKLLASGGRILFSLPPCSEPATFRILHWRGAKKDLGSFRKIVDSPAKLPDLHALTKGGPRRWKSVIEVKGDLGKESGPYQVDDIPLPDANPWGSWMRPGAFDFFRDGRAALCTWNGDVWIVSGLDDKLASVKWQRFATGLFEPLGLKIVDDVIHALGRDQITRLHDLNGDGEADFYENFNNSAPVVPTFHGFAMELHTDSQGNFYYSRGAHRVTPGAPLHGGIIKVSKDGKTAELFATGLREANGMSIGPGDIITAADNQGSWVPSSKIDIIHKGGFYGYNWGTQFTDYVKPLCWIPFKLDNSSGGQAWVVSDKWGPFRSHMLHTSYGTCKLFLVLSEKTSPDHPRGKGGVGWQGGVVEMPLKFDAGIMRGHFNPLDGQLYLCGLKGWQTAGKRDGGFYRVRYTGKPAYFPKDLRIAKEALHITFTCPLEAAAPENFALEQWNYRWSSGYGSKDYSVSDPNRVGRDPVSVKSVKLSADRRTVTLEVLALQPVMQMGITCNLKAVDGTEFTTTIYNTVNKVP